MDAGLASINECWASLHQRQTAHSDGKNTTSHLPLFPHISALNVPVCQGAIKTFSL